MKKRSLTFSRRVEKALQSGVETMRLLFWAALAWRFLRPFYHNPLHHLFSDPQRHWENGLNLLQPTISCGLDNKLYQVYIYLLALISQKQEGLIALYTGLLSAAMALVWYRAAKEIFPRYAALPFALAVATCPSFTAIYNYFMPETLMLVLVGLGLWLTLRAARKESFRAAALALSVWALACYTRTIGIPMMAVALAYLTIRCPRPAAILAVAALAIAVLAVPAGMQSRAGIGAFAPFGIGGVLNSIYRKSNADTIYIHMYERGGWVFSSPSYYVNPFDPFVTYQSHRHEKDYHFSVRTGDGMNAWREEYRKAQENYSWADWRRDFQENAIFLFFTPSWPDNNPYIGNDFPLRVNYHLRWMWPPVMLLVLLAGLLARTDERRAFLLGFGWCVLLALMLQQMGPMEGRYRKPAEPLWLLNLGILAAAWLAPSGRKRDRRTAVGWAVHHGRKMLRQLR